MPHCYELLLVEDRKEIQQELRDTFAIQPDIKLVAVAATVRNALRELSRPLDIILLDLDLPDGSGHQILRAAKAQARNVKVAVFTVFADDTNTLAAIEAGADAYILKGTGDIPNQIRRTLRGENPLAPTVTQHLLKRLRSVTHPHTQLEAPDSPTASAIRLTPRERETLTGLAQGMSYQEIADNLMISSHTITDYSKSLYRKLGVHSRSEAVLQGVRLGLVSF